MVWSEILIVFVAVVSILLLIYKRQRFTLLFQSYGVIILLAVAVIYLDIPFGGEEISAKVTGWLMITATTFILILLANLIRQMKPVYTRYPVQFSYTPLVILITYPFVLEVESIRILLNLILQGGIIAISVLLYGSIYRKFDNHFFYLIGILSLTLSYMIFWFIEDVSAWIWQVPIAAGLLLTTIGFNDLLIWLNSGRRRHAS